MKKKDKKDTRIPMPGRAPNLNETMFSDNYNLSPSASDLLTDGGHLTDDVRALDGGTMLSTSEIIDFGDGADST